MASGASLALLSIASLQVTLVGAGGAPAGTLRGPAAAGFLLEAFGGRVDVALGALAAAKLRSRNRAGPNGDFWEVVAFGDAGGAADARAVCTSLKCDPRSGRSGDYTDQYGTRHFYKINGTHKWALHLSAWHASRWGGDAAMFVVGRCSGGEGAAVDAEAARVPAWVTQGLRKTLAVWDRDPGPRARAFTQPVVGEGWLAPVRCCCGFYVPGGVESLRDDPSPRRASREFEPSPRRASREFEPSPRRASRLLLQVLTAAEREKVLDDCDAEICTGCAQCALRKREAAVLAEQEKQRHKKEAQLKRNASKQGKNAEKHGSSKKPYSQKRR